MNYIGELISIGVAFMWTGSALFAEYGTKRLGTLPLNVLRMALVLVLSVAMFWALTGQPLPPMAGGEAYVWLLLSGLVGYVVGDYCLFQCYLLIGSRYGQLLMTLAPISTAVMARVALGQHIGMHGILAMVVTLSGVAISVLGRDDAHNHKLRLELPLRGVLYGLGAAACQGVGLVLSKLGMDCYSEALPADVGPWLLPFFSNFVRCIAGIVGFALLLSLKEGWRPMRRALSDKRGLMLVLLTTLPGAFLGVGCSLLALQYTSAGISSTLSALSPIIILVPAYWLQKQRVTLKSVVGAVVSVIGVSIFFLL